MARWKCSNSFTGWIRNVHMALILTYIHLLMYAKFLIIEQLQLLALIRTLFLVNVVVSK